MYVCSYVCCVCLSGVCAVHVCTYVVCAFINMCAVCVCVVYGMWCVNVRVCGVCMCVGVCTCVCTHMCVACVFVRTCAAEPGHGLELPEGCGALRDGGMEGQAWQQAAWGVLGEPALGLTGREAHVGPGAPSSCRLVIGTMAWPGWGPAELRAHSGMESPGGGGLENRSGL